MQRARLHAPSLVLIDPDRVEEKNIGRQALFAPADIGQPKAECVARRLNAALAVAAEHRPDVRRGDAFDLLPELVAAIPEDVTPVVFHCMTLAHMGRPQRERFPQMLAELAAARDGDLVWLGVEYVETDSLHRGRFRPDGSYDLTKLADVNPHGAWLEWLAS